MLVSAGGGGLMLFLIFSEYGCELSLVGVRCSSSFFSGGGVFTYDILEGKFWNQIFFFGEALWGAPPRKLAHGNREIIIDREQGKASPGNKRRNYS